jgi:hypothetical protein
LLLDPERITLRGRDAGQGTRDAAEPLRERIEHVRNTTPLLFVPYVGVLAMLPIAFATASRQEDLVDFSYQAFVSALRVHTLSPGQRAQGVLLLRAQDSSPAAHELTLELVLTDLASGAELQFSLQTAVVDPGTPP